MKLDEFSSFWNVVTSIGAVLIPLALYYVKTEIANQGSKIDRKLDVHIKAFEDHIKSDEDFQERNEKSMDSIKNRLNIV